jgi:electron transfer flavoprotein beta subunit
MRTLMPALQKARAASIGLAGSFAAASVPSARRDTRVVKDMSPDAVAQEIVEWIRQ